MKKSMKGFISLVAIVVLISALLLSGCSKTNNANDTNKENNGSKANNGSGDADAPTVLGIKLTDLDGGGTLKGQYKGQKIVIATVAGDFDKALNEAAPYFEAVSGADVEVQGFPWEALLDKIQVGLSAGNQFDAVVMPVAFLHGYAQNGFLADLNKYINDDKVASPNLDIGDYIPSVLEAYGKFGDQLIAFPFKPDAQTFFYRKDLFEDQKIKDAFKAKTGSELKVPVTPEEMAMTAAFFTKSLNPDSPTTYGYSTMADKGSSRWIWMNRLAAFGGDDVDDNYKPVMNSEAGLKAMNFMLELQKFAPKELTEMGFDVANNLFVSGEVAMMEQWPGLSSAANKDESKVKGKVGYAITPGGAPVLGGWAVSMASKSKNPEATYKFLEFITSKDGEILKIKHTMDPTRTSNFNRPEVAAYNDMYPNLLKSLTAGKLLADIGVPLLSSKLNDIEEFAIHAVLKKEMTPQQGLEYMVENFDKEIKAAGLNK
jgi:multiple sugar transport system substrate-binding protein